MNPLPPILAADYRRNVIVPRVQASAALVIMVLVILTVLM